MTITTARGEVLHWDLVRKGRNQTESQADVGIDGKGRFVLVSFSHCCCYLKKKIVKQFRIFKLSPGIQGFLVGCFQKWGYPQNGWFIMENPIKNGMIWGYHYFWKHPVGSKSPTFQALVATRKGDRRWFWFCTKNSAGTALHASMVWTPCGSQH